LVLAKDEVTQCICYSVQWSHCKYQQHRWAQT